jgi:hypothetical protein
MLDGPQLSDACADTYGSFDGVTAHKAFDGATSGPATTFQHTRAQAHCCRAAELPTGVALAASAEA